ncbi:hypothetical protein D1007_19178 [Hordeum vulgare]|nr:hypothetical protein D1007_19178 [Hordeum vulgare]
MLSEDVRKALDRGGDCVESVADNSWITPGSTPSKASGSWSHNIPAGNSVADSAAASRVPSVVGVEEDAEPDEEVPINDDEDEMMYPELVDIASQQGVEDEYPEEPITRARFDDTDYEEKGENMDSLIDNEYDGEDMPTIEWNREAPELTEGTIFQSMVDCRNGVITWCILNENTYKIKRSERLMTVIGGAHGEVDQYCSEYFSVAKFMAAYADNVPALLGKDQWNIVDPRFKLHSHVMTRPPGRLMKNRFKTREEGRLPKRRACRKCGVLGHIARLCTNPVTASFGEEERWTTANAEENVAAMEIEDAEENAAAMEIEYEEENAATLEIEANEEVPTPCSREKRPRDEETEEFEAMAFDGFETIREEEEGVIVPVDPLKIIEPTDEKDQTETRSKVVKPKPQVKIKIIKCLYEKSISTRETRSKAVKRAANTRSKSKI